MKKRISLLSLFILTGVLNIGTTTQALADEVGNVYDCANVPFRSRKNVRWRNNDVTFFVQNTIWNNQALRNELQGAAAKWNEAAKGQFTVTLRSGTGAMAHNNGRNEIFMASIPGSTIADANSDWGSTNLSTGKCFFTEADIRFDTNVTWDGVHEYGDRGQPFNFGLVAVHEIGHTLGHLHDNNSQKSMNSQYPNGGSIGKNYEEGPFASDRHKVRRMYGTGNSFTDRAASAWVRSSATPGSAIPIDLIKDNRITPTNGSVSRGEFVFFPYSVHNLSSATKDLQVKFYMSADRTMGNAGDTYLGQSWYTLPAGTDLSAEKYVRIPSSYRGFRYFGYKIVTVNGETTSQRANNEVSLYRHYWVN